MKKFDFILLVDDDPIANFLTERLLRKLDIFHKIQTAANGEQAIAMIQEENAKGNPSPDLILLDINMPVMNGLEFLEIFKGGSFADKEKTKFAILSTTTHPRDYENILARGVAHIIHKPLTEAKLMEVLEGMK